MKRVSEERYLKKIMSLAKPNPDGTPRVVPDAPTRIEMQGAWHIVQHIRHGRVVAESRDAINHETKFFIEC